MNTSGISIIYEQYYDEVLIKGFIKTENISEEDISLASMLGHVIEPIEEFDMKELYAKVPKSKDRLIAGQRLWEFYFIKDNPYNKEYKYKKYAGYPAYDFEKHADKEMFYEVIKDPSQKENPLRYTTGPMLHFFIWNKDMFKAEELVKEEIERLMLEKKI